MRAVTRLSFMLLLALSFSACTGKATYFKRLTGFSPGADVHNIQYKDDVLLDAVYWLGFDCSAATAEKIIKDLNLSPDTAKDRGNYATCCYYPKAWWDTALIARAAQYSVYEDKRKIFFWYDPATRKAFLLKFIP